MKRAELEQLVKTGREIEFMYNSKRYSITYYGDSRENYISFCEFYKEPTDVKNTDELLEIKINNIALKSILLNLTDENIWIF